MTHQLKHILTFLRNIRYSKFKSLLVHSGYIKKVINEFTLDDTQILNSNLRESVFVLNACINPFDDNNYASYDAPKDVNKRFQQVLEGIESVRKYFDFAFIVYVENSKIPAEYENQIKDRVNVYMNFSNNYFLTYSRKISNKGVPWSMANLLALKELNQKSLYFRDYHFLNARYKVSPLSLDNTKINRKVGFMHAKMKTNNLTTIYFFFSSVSMTRIFNIFRQAHVFSICGFSVEDVFSIFFMRKKYLKQLGITGTINALDQCSE